MVATRAPNAVPLFHLTAFNHAILAVRDWRREILAHWWAMSGQRPISQPNGPRRLAGSSWRLLAPLIPLLGFISTSWAEELGSLKPLLTCDGHTSEVYTVCFSADGQRIASASNAEAKVWDAATGKELLHYRTRGTNVFGVALHPDNQRLAVSVSHEVRIVEIATGKEATILKCAPDFLFRIGFSPNGKYVAAAGGQNGIQPGNVHVWEIESGRKLFSLAGHTAPALTVAFSGDGKHLVSGSGATNGTKAGELIVWDSGTGDVVRMLRGHSNNIYGAAVSRDGRLIASSSGSRVAPAGGEVKLWEVLTGKELFDFTGHAGTIFSIAISPDGSRLATAGTDKSFRIWDARTGAELFSVSAHSSGIYCVAFSPDGLRVATAGQDRSVKVWQLPAVASAVGQPPSHSQMRLYWQDLAAEPVRAHRAIVALSAAPEQTLPLLRKLMCPVAPLSAEQQQQVARWLRELDDQRFAAREQASRELARFGEVVMPALRKEQVATNS